MDVTGALLVNTVIELPEEIIKRVTVLERA
jgi:hypothetical protein